ncbi:MAG: excinuclease ABC subunit UvrA [Acutalibacteraceae bacterium]|nr:excinuclease ABC subunit UvrA [Acutalibacteraceae bacterium]
MASDKLIIKGANEHNLKNIDVEIPRDKLVVFTGLSGSGKSSLAFDTIYAEGQRRYVESLSSYARQFLGQMEKPDVETIDGLSPAISIDQKTTSKNPRSTVGTVTEIYDYLRLLYARVGVPHCPVCGKEISQQTTDQIVDVVMGLPEGSKIQVLSPVVKGRKGEHQKELEAARKSGYVRVRIDGNIYDLSEEIKLDKNKKHMIEVVVDRLVIKSDIRSRLTDSIETATNLSGGLIAVDVVGGDELQFSQSYACEEHGISIPELTPTMFSFNNPMGACPTCTGIGVFKKIDPRLIISDEDKSLKDGCIKAAGWGVNSYFNPDAGSLALMYYDGVARKFGFDINTPWRDIPEEAKNVVLYGSGEEKLELHRNTDFGGGTYYAAFEGVVNNVQRRYENTKSDWARAEYETYMSETQCPDCKGARLKPEYLAVTVGGINIEQFCNMSIGEEITFINGLQFGARDQMIAKPILKEINSRLSFLSSVGLEYLCLSRSAGTLSGGESQRIRLATQIGSSLMGVLYVLDEPSIGLHQRDNERLLNTLKRLRDLGNTLIVVEHDEDTMRAADYIVDIGPGAGIHGGHVVFSGTPKELEACTESLTSDYLTGRKRIPIPEKRRKGNGGKLVVKGAAENNLKNIDVKIPLGQFVCVTGVSGSGKSSLVNDIIYKVLANRLNRAKTIAGKYKSVDGIELLDKVIDIDQSPIGRTPRSNPATYTGVFNDIRELFASTKDAKAKGYNAGRFSFNVKGGRCEACSGDGILKIEMHFLPDIYVPCEVCGGTRYNRETLNVRYKGKNIYDVLEMTVEEGMYFFESHPKIYRKLKTLFDVGLGYIKIGQSATTLSGGEAQRVKLATELSKRSTGKTIYILDEPTTGLHTADVHRLIEVLHRFVDAGNTVLVIEHNLDVIKTADHIIDLGPEGGNGGGTVVVAGTPEEVCECEASYTGKFLKRIL